jgi:hypothetical protein
MALDLVQQRWIGAAAGLPLLPFLSKKTQLAMFEPYQAIGWIDPDAAITVPPNMRKGMKLLMSSSGPFPLRQGRAELARARMTRTFEFGRARVDVFNGSREVEAIWIAQFLQFRG